MHNRIGTYVYHVTLSREHLPLTHLIKQSASKRYPSAFGCSWSGIKSSLTSRPGPPPSLGTNKSPQPTRLILPSYILDSFGAASRSALLTLSTAGPKEANFSPCLSHRGGQMAGKNLNFLSPLGRISNIISVPLVFFRMYSATASTPSVVGPGSIPLPRSFVPIIQTNKEFGSSAYPERICPCPIRYSKCCVWSPLTATTSGSKSSRWDNSDKTSGTPSARARGSPIPVPNHDSVMESPNNINGLLRPLIEPSSPLRAAYS
mmetsp:Transcript_18449/g.53200  ORF Transcript_18449/g.53200 Transcript_18449/m.53200 type:complete len:261 (-) Transcript_18449:395-1177(-)